MFLVVQHIWTRWTKATRGGTAAKRRPKLREAYALPSVPTAQSAWLHDIRALEKEEFETYVRWEPLTLGAWTNQKPPHPANLRWRIVRNSVELDLLEPTPSCLQTPWPAALPRPLITLAAGETCRMDWNARFRASAFGSNLSTHFEEHRYWVAACNSCETGVFIDDKPTKHIDLRGSVY